MSDQTVYLFSLCDYYIKMQPDQSVDLLYLFV